MSMVVVPMSVLVAVLMRMALAAALFAPAFFCAKELSAPAAL